MPFEPLALAGQLPMEGGLGLCVTRIYQPGDSPWGSGAYRFDIQVAGERAGTISLRVGDSELLRRLAGHVGFSVEPGFRGRRLAERATRLILPLARAHRIDPVSITCAPDNLASIRTIERLGARYVETVDLPPDYDSYARGERQKRVYHITP